MQTRNTLDPLQTKTWQLDDTAKGLEGYLYYCLICDEALVLSRVQISQRRIGGAFNERCPGCGFELEHVLSCKASILPAGRRFLANLKCIDADYLFEKSLQTNSPPQKATSLLKHQLDTITTGIGAIDETLILAKGQLVFLQGESSHTLSLMYCARAIVDSEVVFIDAGNLFDTTTSSQHGTKQGMDNAHVQERIHLSRAFTHHQVHNLIMQKLPSDIEEYHPTLAVVSDITALFCDPDVRETRESLRMFKENVQFLAGLAGRQKILIIVTNIKTRNRKMEEVLERKAHVSALLKDEAGYTQVKINRHPFVQEGLREVNLKQENLTGYLSQL